MNQITFLWSGDAPSSGDALAGKRGHVVVVPKVGIQTPDALIGWPPNNEGLLYVRLADDGTTFAGTGLNDHDGAWRWTKSDGWRSEGKGYGPKSCIFVGQVLHVVRKSPAGAVGYRHVRPDGTIVTVMESYIDTARRLYEYTDYGDVAFGQGDDEIDSGGVVVRFADDGVRRRLTHKDLRARGRIRDIVVRRAGDDFAVVAIDYDQHRTTITYATLAELRAMEPVEGVPPNPPDPPTPDPPKPPIPPIPPEENTMIAFAPAVAGFLPGKDEPHPDGNGQILVRLPSGKVLCCTPDGALETRDHAGPWEAFRKGASSIIAERGDKVFVFPVA